MINDSLFSVAYLQAALSKLLEVRAEKALLPPGCGSEAPRVREINGELQKQIDGIGRLQLLLLHKFELLTGLLEIPEEKEAAEPVSQPDDGIPQEKEAGQPVIKPGTETPQERETAEPTSQAEDGIPPEKEAGQPENKPGAETPQEREAAETASQPDDGNPPEKEAGQPVIKPGAETPQEKEAAETASQPDDGIPPEKEAGQLPGKSGTVIPECRSGAELPKLYPDEAPEAMETYIFKGRGQGNVSDLKDRFGGGLAIFQAYLSDRADGEDEPFFHYSVMKGTKMAVMLSSPRSMTSVFSREPDASSVETQGKGVLTLRERSHEDIRMSCDYRFFARTENGTCPQMTFEMEIRAGSFFHESGRIVNEAPGILFESV